LNKTRTSYRRIHIEDVVEEADFLLDMSLEERLSYASFKYDPLKHGTQTQELEGTL